MNNYYVLNFKTKKCLKSFDDFKSAFDYCRKVKHKGINSILISLDLDNDKIVSKTYFGDIETRENRKYWIGETI